MESHNSKFLYIFVILIAFLWVIEGKTIWGNWKCQYEVLNARGVPIGRGRLLSDQKHQRLREDAIIDKEEFYYLSSITFYKNKTSYLIGKKLERPMVDDGHQNDQESLKCIFFSNPFMENIFEHDAFRYSEFKGTTVSEEHCVEHYSKVDLGNGNCDYFHDLFTRLPVRIVNLEQTQFIFSHQRFIPENDQKERYETDLEFELPSTLRCEPFHSKEAGFFQWLETITHKEAFRILKLQHRSDQGIGGDVMGINVGGNDHH